MRLFLLQQLVVFLFAIPDATAKDIIIETEDSEPIITTQPLSQLECEGNSVRFKVIASGSGLTYTWQRKRPTDPSFVTITDSENNTDYSLTNDVRIGNVGSAQYPHGTQFQVIVSNGSAAVTSSVATLTVNSINSILPIATNVTKCYGESYSYTVTTSYPANVVSYRWKKSVATGVWDEISDGEIYSGATTATLNITGGTPAESGEYRAYITFKSSGADCNVASTSRTRKITFLPQLTTPVTTIIQPTCLVQGTIEVAVQSATDTYSFNNGLSFQASNEKSGLEAGFYNVIVKNTAGCVSPTAICQIDELGQASTWNGNIWLNGIPDASRRAVFEQNFDSIADIEACSCQVINGANVLINGAHTLKITNAVNVVDGSLTFENNASLVQVNDDVENSGNIIYKRITPKLNRYDFTYWSSPVAGMTLGKLSPTTFYDKYFSYNNAWVLETRETAMKKGEGYSVRAPQTTPISGGAEEYPATFTGVPHNGLVTLTSLAGDQAHLLGNPYPSAIDADEFLKLNSDLSVPEDQRVLEGTLYFWTHNSPPSDAIFGTKKYNYTTNDYATYNRTGGVGTGGTAAKADPKLNYLSGTNFSVPTGNIAAGQGFFASTKAGGNVVFNNTMRISGGVSGIDNSQFFKTSTNSKTNTKAATTEKNRIWLNLTNDEGAFKQTLIGYITGATNEYDAGFDAITYDGNQYVDFYSVNQGVKLAIQGRALPFKKQDSVALGYRSTIKGEFQISIDHTDGVLDSEDVFLEDNDLQILHDLKKESYSFTTEKGVFHNRFVLRYLDKNAVEEEIEQELELGEGLLKEAVIVSVRDQKITINSVVTTLEKVVVYSVSGRKMFQRNKVNANVFVIPQLISSHQVAVVNIVLSDGRKFSRKIIY